MESKKLIANNIIVTFGSKLITLALGVVLPRLLITSYGSEMNGLLATITQIFTYLALVEAGIGNSTVNALYKPLDTRNYAEANEVVNEARRYYRKVSLIYGACIFAFSVIYPLVVQTTVDRWLVFWIIILQGGASFVAYYFSAVYNQLLIASGKRYVNENITLISYVAVSIVKIILLRMGCNVLVVQIGHFVINIIKVPILIRYCRKKYEWLDFSIVPKVRRLKERGAFVVHELSTTIFNNTDILLISSFCSLAMSSVYSVYNLVFSSLNNILVTVNGSLSFVIGQVQYKGREQTIKTYDMYNTLYTGCVFAIFSVAAVMIEPFVKLYMAGVTDIDYLISGFPLLFAMINILSGWRATAALLITVSGHASKTQMRSILETVINIVASVILVILYDVKGVLLGTIIALIYRSNDIVIYVNRKVLQRYPWKEYVLLLIYGLLFVGIFLGFKTIELPITNFFSFFGYAALVGIVVLLIYGIATILISKELRMRIVRMLIR